MLKPLKANAVNYVYDSNPSYTPNYYGQNSYQSYYQAPYQAPTPQVQYNYPAPSNPAQVSYQTVPIYTGNSNAASTKTSSTIYKATTTGEVLKKPESSAYSSLAANAIYGTKSFGPSGLIQWILLAILILIITILTRRVFARRKYHNSPLKHA